MIGFPWETKEVIEDTIDYAKKLNANICQFSRVTPFKKTELFAMADIKNDNSLKEQAMFEGSVKYRLENLNEEQMHELIKKAHREFYLRIKKAIDIFNTVKLCDLIRLVLYCFKTKSM